MLMLFCLMMASCGSKNLHKQYDPEYYSKMTRIQKARSDYHECRTTDGIKKEQRDNERVVNDTITQKYIRTDWKVSNGFGDCYHFISYDNREYKVKNKFTATRLGKPNENETIVKEIIIENDSFLTKTDQYYLRNFYDAIHKKKRPLNTEEKYELYEQKHLKKDTKGNRKPCLGKDYKDITKCELYPTQFDHPLFSINEIIELQKEHKDAKIGFYDYENSKTFVFVGTNFTDEDIENFASGYYSLQDGLITISKANQQKVARQLKIDKEKVDRACWFEEYENMKLCHKNSNFDIMEKRKKYGSKRIYTKRYITRTFIDYPKVMVNGVMMQRGINYANRKSYERTERVELTDVEYLCKNSTMSDESKIKSYNYDNRYIKDVFYAKDLPENYCMLD